MAEVRRFPVVDEEIDKLLNKHDLPPELKVVDENIQFEKKVQEHPVTSGVGKVDVFGTSWDINSILKGNYWRRSIYTTDKLCKLFLKADLKQKEKYLRKRNPMGFNFLWIILLMVGGIVALLVIVFLLPKLGVI